MDANGKPSNKGILEVADNAGNVLSGVNRLRLGSGMSMSLNTADPSILIDVGGGASGQPVNAVDNAAALRAMSSGSLSAAKVGMTMGYSTVGDGGGAVYDWLPSNTDTDDGAITIKVTAVTTGRFKFRMPADKIFPLASCSLDGTGVTHVGTALGTLCTTLYNAGYEGIRGTGNKKYNIAVQGYSIPPRTEFYPWKHYRVRLCGDGHVVGGSGGQAADITVESGITGAGSVNPLTVNPYGPRTFTQTLLAGVNTFVGVTDIRNLTVGDTILIRYGADPSDASGVEYVSQFAKIAVITPGSGNTGDITIDNTVIETPLFPLPAYNINSARQGNHHDLFKITGFQDFISFDDECELITCGIEGLYTRGFNVNNIKGYNLSQFAIFFGSEDTSLQDVWIDSILGLNTSGGDPAGDPFANYGWCAVLDKTRRTSIGNLTIEKFNASGGVLDNESQCRDTALTGITAIGIWTLPIPAPLLITNGIVCTPFSFDIVSADYLTYNNGGEFNGSINLRIKDFILGDTRAFVDGVATQPQPGDIGAGQVSDCLVFRGNEYRAKRHCQVLCSPIAVNNTTVFAIPVNGIIRACRVRASSVTGITSFKVGKFGSANPGIDIHTSLSSGNWVNAFEPTRLSQSRGNFGSDSQDIAIVTDGTFSASTYIVVEFDIFCIERKYDGTETYTDTSAMDRYSVAAAPTVSANFVGQQVIGDSNTSVYTAVTVGNGASDWVKSAGGDMLRSQNLSGLANNATARANIGADAAYQPLDSDLTAIAALSTTSYGRAFLALANQAALVALLPNSGTTAGRLDLKVQIDQQNLSAANSYGIPSFTANLYRKLIIEFEGTYNGTMLMQVNSDTGANYSSDFVSAVSTLAQPLNSDNAGNMTIGATNDTGTENIIEVEFFPLNNGRRRIGLVKSHSVGTDGAIGHYFVLRGGIWWNNTGSNVTTLLIFPSTGTITGTVRVYGVPA